MVTATHLAETIPLTALGIHHTARVTGLSVNQLQRWDRNGFFQPSFADPNRRRPYSRVYARNDVLALGMIARLREAGAPLTQIKPLLPLLAPDEHGDWLTRCFHVVGKRVYVSRDEAIAAARQRGEFAEPACIGTESVIFELKEAIARLQERQPEHIGRVTRNRGIMGGAPIIAGTRIPTETIAWFHSHGYSLTEILENFPRLTAKDVEAAVAFENEQRPKAPEPLLVHG
jgi:uncharacterized protein (DUF433 family)